MRPKTFQLMTCLLLVLPFFSSRSFAQTLEEQSVAKAVENLRNAMVNPNDNTLDRLVADELSYGHSSGMVQNKAAFIEGLVSGKSNFVSIDITEQTIKVVGNTAIVRHHFAASTKDGGIAGTVKLSILLVWQKQKDEWRLLARQAVKLP